MKSKIAEMKKHLMYSSTINNKNKLELYKYPSTED